jgi:excisionase family DNA binding protein
VRNTSPTVSDDLTVAEAADALGTSPQTVRRLLRDGELRGRRPPWGNRFVWVPSRKGVDEFLSQNGRLDGRRRGRPATGELRAVPDITEPRARASPPPSAADARPDRRPRFLRPRGALTLKPLRATYEVQAHLAVLAAAFLLLNFTQFAYQHW